LVHLSASYVLNLAEREALLWQTRVVTSNRITHRWALWAFAVALVLKTAVPLLASASAHIQGKALVEVCTVYGVALKELPGDTHEPGSDHKPGHGSEHCALTGLTALLTVEPPALALPAPSCTDTVKLLDRSRLRGPDACASWVARLKHGPPSMS
jgi:hypothetical protein